MTAPRDGGPVAPKRHLKTGRAGGPVAPKRHSKTGREGGFSLVEVIVAMAIMVVITGAIFGLMASGQSAIRTQPEVADMNQRLRIAADMIYRDLLMAGAGAMRGTGAGPLSLYFPAILPQRTGAVSPDGDLSFSNDRVSIFYISSPQAQTATSANMSSGAAAVTVKPNEPGCPPGTSCGLATGQRAMIYDVSAVGAGYNLFTITGVSINMLSHAAPNPAFAKAYAADVSRVAAAEHRVYYLNAVTSQLMLYDGYQTDTALVDDVTSLRFTYFADPDPNSAPPPGAGLANCVYDAGSPPVPKLANLGGTAPVALASAQLTDGPVCGIAPTRFDGDLLRVRKVRVQITVRPASLSLRSGAGRSGEKYVPDYTMAFEVTPRNLNLGR